MSRKRKPKQKSCYSRRFKKSVVGASTTKTNTRSCCPCPFFFFDLFNEVKVPELRSHQRFLGASSMAWISFQLWRYFQNLHLWSQGQKHSNVSELFSRSSVMFPPPVALSYQNQFPLFSSCHSKRRHALEGNQRRKENRLRIIKTTMTSYFHHLLHSIMHRANQASKAFHVPV